MNQESTKSSYTVMARRYRPQQFKDVVGQQSVAQALRNAIQAGRVAHAYLFTGARGVGKTSMARILAKALNCPHAVDAEPCNECDVCQGISSGQDVDILEIDGASNRGIDDIRTLRQNVTVKSMRSKYKMYIIDEVHMLTKDAFNALLKTLEEPPPFVKFVFCTTEPNKLPDTILSRCQRFDFGTIETMKIAERLAWIAEREGVEVSPEAIDLVARRARGSLRDSQSLFDQLLAYGQLQISAQDVHQLLGTAPDDRLMELGQHLVEHQPAQALELSSRIFDAGTQMGEFLNQLVDYFRDLMILAAGASEMPLSSVAEANRAQLANQAGQWGLHGILAGLQILTDTQTKFSRVLSGRSLYDLAIVRLALLDELDDLGELAQLLTNPGSGSGISEKPKPGGNSSTPPKRPTELRPNFGKSGSTKKSDQGAERGEGGTHSPVAESSIHLNDPSSGADSRENSRSLRSTIDAENVGRSYSDNSTHDGEESNSPNSQSDRRFATGMEQPTVPQNETGENNENLQPGMEQDIFSEVMKYTGDMIRTHLQRADSLAIIAPNALEIRFPKSYTLSKEYCERQEIVSQIEKIVAKRTGKPCSIRFVFVETQPVAGVSLAKSTVATDRGDKGRKAKDQPIDEYVKSVQTVFSGTLKEIMTVSRPLPKSTMESIEQDQESEHV